MTNPTLVTTPFAENGDKNTIPQSVGAEPQNATLEKGFPEITQTPISAGGIPPERKDFNGILNLYGQHIVHLEKGLPYEFDAAFATAIGGYPLHARIMLSNGDIVKNTIASNSVDPNSDLTNWVKINSTSQIFDDSDKSQEQINTETSAALTGKADKSTTLSGYGITDAYTKSQVDSTVSAIANGSKSYQTLALAQAAATGGGIPANSSVYVTNDSTSSNNGLYTYNGTTLTKSIYDPVAIAAADATTKANAAQANAISAAALDATTKANTAELNSKNYTDSNISSVNLNAGFNIVLNAKTSTINETFKSLNNAFIDGVLVYGTLPSDLRISGFPSKSTVDAGITNGTITIRGDNLNFNSAQFNVIAGGERLEVLFNNANFVAKFYIDFTKAPSVAVNNNSSGYFFDVSRLNIKQNSRKDGYFAKQSYSETRSKVINDSYKIPKIINNYLNDTFLNPIAFYPDLSTTAGSIPTNSNLQDPDYTWGYRLTHNSSYSKIYDDFAGESLKYPVNFGTSPTSLFTVSNIYRNCEMLVGMKIDSSLVKASSFVIRNGSGAENRYSFFDGVASQTNNTHVSATLISNDIDTGYSIWKIIINPDLAVNASQVQSITARNTSASTGTFDIIAYNPILSKKINYQSDIPQSKTKDSPWVGKNLMYFGDSNSRGNIAIEMIKNLGCNVYWNAAGGRSMQYRGVSEVETDLGWLYHWTRRSHIKNIKDSGKLLDLFLFNASYNDSSGGGTLSDAAIQAVLDNYPTLQDDADTVTAKLAIFNSLTIAQRKSIFGYKQTFAAYLLQIITMFPTAKIFLTTMLYSPAAPNYLGSTSGTVNEQRATDKAVRDAINADIRLVAQWYGVSVIDVNSNAGYYYGNMTTYTSDTIHFNEVVGKRIGYFEAKSILMQTF